jgi:putative ABC transport system ATP-binding protein
VLKLDDVSRTYRRGKVETQVVKGVSLEIARGEFVAITGPSGCGKSTLLNLMGLLDRPSSGRYWFNGEDVTGCPESRLARLRNDAVGFVFQSFNLIEEMSVADNVEAALIYRGVRGAERKARVQAALEKVGVAEQAKARPGRLSGGEQQRVAFARALVSRPQILLADEPTGNLDTENGAAVMALIKQAVAEGVTVVMVTHSLAHAQEAQRTIRLLDGQVVADGRIDSSGLLRVVGEDAPRTKAG